MIRMVIFVTIVGIVVLVGWMMVQNRTQAEIEENLLKLDTIESIEKNLGQPLYTFSSPNNWFAKDMVTPEEFKEGITVRAYLVKKTPPRFLIVKVGSEGRLVIKSQIETS